MIVRSAAVVVLGDAVFSNARLGDDAAVTVAVDGADVTAGPVGGVPEAVAVFTIEPASMSACVVTYVLVHVVDARGASVVTGHVIADGVPDPENDVFVTPTPVRVVSPVLVMTYEYVTVWPGAVTVLGDAVFCNASDEICTGTTVEAFPADVPCWVGVSALANLTLAVLVTVVPGELGPRVTRNVTEVDCPGPRVPPLVAFAPVPSCALTWLPTNCAWSSPGASVLGPALGPDATTMLPGT
ncbi:hypothetical protein [Streptosporangium sp. NPDC002721]|uniref:hypothetical protein n=1 Tax=Streptosporangium sp. NPDC002721 TaxID=3366188 RepID=UPI00368456DB